MTNKCCNCGSEEILVRENENRFYTLTYLRPEDNYYETGKEHIGYSSVLDQDFVCNECNHVMMIDEVVIEDDEDDDLGERTAHTFASSEAAAAFCEGLEFANDTSLGVGGPYESEAGNWTVYTWELPS